jgi:V-containing nitrogenase delta subunit
MEEKARELYKFIQERYLWQFYSRTWDRDENINGILKKFAGIVTGEESGIADSPKERAFYAEAKMVAAESRKKFPWLDELEKDQIRAIVEEVREKLIDVAITRSQNCELNNPNY